MQGSSLAEQGENFVVTEFVAYKKRHVIESIQVIRSRTGLCLDDDVRAGEKLDQEAPRERRSLAE